MKKSMMIVIASLVSMIFAEGISGVSYFRFSPGVTADGEDHGFYMDRAYLTYKKNIAEGVLLLTTDWTLLSSINLLRKYTG